MQAQDLRPLHVLTSIKPIYGLTLAMTQGTTTQVSLLLPDHASEHDYFLKPSERQAISKADLFIWGGPELESFLVRPLQGRQRNQPLLTLLPGAPIQYKQQGVLDPHVWLHPHNADAWVQLIAEELARLDPAQAAHYHHNAQHFSQMIQTFQPQSLTGIYYIAYHNAFAYWDSFSGSQTLGILRPHDHGSSPKQLTALYRLLEHNPTICLSREPFIQDPLLKQLAHAFKRPILLLDPLGLNIPATPHYYEDLLNNLQTVFSKCSTLPGQLKT